MPAARTTRALRLVLWACLTALAVSACQHARAIGRRTDGSGGLPPDLELANALYQKACELGDGAGCNNLAVAYEKGRGVAVDLGRAAELYGKACELGDGWGCNKLGNVLQAGRGVPQDQVRANAAFDKACGLGNGQGCWSLGYSHERGRGVAADQGRANALYEKACGLGSGGACDALGTSYQWAKGVAPDLVRAGALYARSCELGNGPGCVDLAINHQDGRGVARDQARANALFDKACGLRDGNGCNHLGLNHELGRGVAVDQARASALYGKACELDDGWGCSNLGYNHEIGRGVPGDQDRANALYDKACRLGNGRGCTNLGWTYEKGRRVAADLARASQLYGKACELEMGVACRGFVRCQLLRARACELDPGLGCKDLVGQLQEPTALLQQLARGCRLGDPASCDQLASRLQSGQAPSEAAVRSLTALARQAPSPLPGVRDWSVFRIVDEASRLPPSSEARLELLEALFQADWKPEGGASSVWRELSAELVERGRSERAAEVLSRVTNPHDLVALRVDRRLVGLVAAHPERFDVDEALGRELARLRAAVQQAPRSLRALSRLLHALTRAPRHQEVVELADEAIRRARGTPSPFDDTEERLAWIMNARADALEGLGRWQEAVDQLAEAARLREDGKRNVSNAINLAFLYDRLDRPREALDALVGLGETSSYGRMEVEQVRFVAALEQGDLASAERALGYLRAHRADAEETLQWVLVAADKPDEAARLLVERLEDPRKRLVALLSVQEYVDEPRTPRMAQWHERWRALLARPEVRSAIAKVGKVERFHLPSIG